MACDNDFVIPPSAGGVGVLPSAGTPGQVIAINPAGSGDCGTNTNGLSPASCAAFALTSTGWSLACSGGGSMDYTITEYP